MLSNEIKLNQNYKHNFHRILVQALKLSGAKEAILVYGTNASLKKHLPLKDWDRGALFDIRSRGLLGFITTIKKARPGQQKHFPVLNHVMKKKQNHRQSWHCTICFKP